MFVATLDTPQRLAVPAFALGLVAFVLLRSTAAPPLLAFFALAMGLGGSAWFLLRLTRLADLLLVWSLLLLSLGVALIGGVLVSYIPFAHLAERVAVFGAMSAYFIHRGASGLRKPADVVHWKRATHEADVRFPVVRGLPWILGSAALGLGCLYWVHPRAAVGSTVGVLLVILGGVLSYTIGRMLQMSRWLRNEERRLEHPIYARGYQNWQKLRKESRWLSWLAPPDAT